MGWTKGAELGVFKGDTFLRLLAKCPQLTLIGVDLWAEQDTPGQEDKIGRDFEGFYLNIQQKADPNRAILIKDWTVQAAEYVDEGSLDFVFIDADHSYEAVKADIAAWKSKIKPTGKMLGHDINWESVQRAVAEVYPNYTTHPDNCWSE